MYDLALIKTNKKEVVELGKKLGFTNIFFIDNSDISKNVRNGLNIYLGGSDDLNRRILTNKNTKILLNPEPNIKDSLSQRNSGLNQVLCKMAYKFRIRIAFSIDRLQDPDMMGKVMQNIKLCRKYKVKMLFFTLAKNKYELRSAHDLLAILSVLGMNAKESQYALTGVSEIMKKKCL